MTSGDIGAMAMTAAGKPLILTRVPRVPPGPGEVEVTLRYAALNHRDLWIALGRYAGLTFPAIPGSDGLGTITAVGAAVDESRLGQTVMINPSLHWGSEGRAQGSAWNILGMPTRGTFAHCVVVPAENAQEPPAHLSSAEAAGLSLAGLTAYRALMTRAGLGPQDRVLITGIGGGVSQMGLMLATAVGARTSVTSSSREKLNRALRMGATKGALYSKKGWWEELLASGGPFDVILDGTGGNQLSDLVRLAAPGGRIASYGATAGDVDRWQVRSFYWKQLSLLGSTLGSPRDYRKFLEAVEKHAIRPVVDSIFPHSQANEALDKMRRSRQFGKILLEYPQP